VLIVSTTGSDVLIPELGIILSHPTVNRDLSSQFSSDELGAALSLTQSIQSGILTWKKTVGGSVELPANYDADYAEVEDLATGPQESRLIRVFGSLATGVIPIWNATTQRWEAGSPSSGVGGGGSGVVPPFTFSKDGNCTVGTAIRTGIVPSYGSGSSGQPIAGSNVAVKLSATNANNLGSTTRIQFARRTGLSTWSDIAGLYINIPAGSYGAHAIGLTALVGPDWEVGCYNKSGASLSNVVVVLYMVPA
jgi:hypothetical protein